MVRVLILLDNNQIICSQRSLKFIVSLLTATFAAIKRLEMRAKPGPLCMMEDREPGSLHLSDPAASPALDFNFATHQSISAL